MHQRPPLNSGVDSLRIQSQKVSLAGKDLVGPTVPVTAEILSQRNSLAKNILQAPQSERDCTQESTFESAGDSGKAKQKTSNQDSMQSNQAATQGPQAKIQALENKVSSLVFQMEQLRPVVKEAQRFLASEKGGSQRADGSRVVRQHGYNNRSRPGSQSKRSASKDGLPVSARIQQPNSQQNQQQHWVASTNPTTMRKPSQNATRKSQVRSKTPILREASKPESQKTEVDALITKVNQSISDGKRKTEEKSKTQQKKVECRLLEQSSKVIDLEQRILDLQQTINLKQKQKEERRKKRRETKKAELLKTMKQQMVDSIVLEMSDIIAQSKASSNAATAEPSQSQIEPVTNNHNAQRMESEDNASKLQSTTEMIVTASVGLSEEIQQNTESAIAEEVEQVIQVDLEKVTTTNTQQVVSKQITQQCLDQDALETPQQRDSERSDIDKFDLPRSLPKDDYSSLIKGPGSKLSQSSKHDASPDTNSPSRLHQQSNHSANNSNSKSSLSNPVKVLQRSGAIPSGYLEQIELALEKLESYSLQSSEDINDSIEQLVSCFNSNTAALQRALQELKNQKAAQERNSTASDGCSPQTVMETANKILFQFDNFAEYTKGEVSGILFQLEERNEECQQSLNLLEGDLLPSQESHMSENSHSKNQTLRLEASKEHLGALKQHILNTQQFLQREAQQIQAKVSELQVSVVKDIEQMFAGSGISPNEAERTSLLSSASRSTQSFLEHATSKNRHRHTLSQENAFEQSQIEQAAEQRISQRSSAALIQNKKLLKADFTPQHHGQLPEFMIFTPSKEGGTTENIRSSHLTKEEDHVSIVQCSPIQSSSARQDRESYGMAHGGAYSGRAGMLKSQISTIPEEEMDADFPAGNVGGGSATGYGRDLQSSGAQASSCQKATRGQTRQPLLENESQSFTQFLPPLEEVSDNMNKQSVSKSLHL